MSRVRKLKLCCAVYLNCIPQMSLAVYSKSKCKVYTVSRGQESGRLLVHTRAALKIMGHCWICVISVCIPLSTWILWICKLTNRYFVVSSLLFFKIYLYQQATTSERKRNFYFWIPFQLSCSFIFFWLLQLKTKSTQNGEFKNKKKKREIWETSCWFFV